MTQDNQVSASAAPARGGNKDDAEYGALVSRIRYRFFVAAGTGPLFTTDAGASLWEAYLDAFPPAQRQYHTCSACRHFFRRYGALVTIDEHGALASAVWHLDDADAQHRPALVAMQDVLQRARVTGVFLSSSAELGTGQTGAWVHFCLGLPQQAVFTSLTRTAGQAMAEKREDFRTLIAALATYGSIALRRAVALLKSETLRRHEKVLGPAQWLLDLREAWEATRNSNLVWRAIATAPPGYCHPRSSMIGTLLDDCAAGLAPDEIKRRFAAKMTPDVYQRPQAAPTAGAIATAEKLVRQLGIERSLLRRHARLDEIRPLWTPRPPQGAPAGGGVFSHLTPKGAAPPLNGTPVTGPTLTWQKFARTALPTADQIALFVPPQLRSYGALLTALDPDAPPILQWDRPEARNPFSWYTWVRGALPSQYGLAVNAYVAVDAITLSPARWDDADGRFAHQGAGLFLVLNGARETRHSGAALFPEILKAELHAVRAVIEAYSRSATPAGADAPHVAGLLLSAGSTWDVKLLVRSSDGSAIAYTIDRWD